MEKHEINIEQLELLVKEYCKTRDKDWFCERYESERDFSENELFLFIEWLKP